jgi:hypothetical protein
MVPITHGIFSSLSTTMLKPFRVPFHQPVAHIHSIMCNLLGSPAGQHTAAIKLLLYIAGFGLEFVGNSNLAISGSFKSFWIQSDMLR